MKIVRKRSSGPNQNNTSQPVLTNGNTYAIDNVPNKDILVDVGCIWGKGIKMKQDYLTVLDNNDSKNWLKVVFALRFINQFLKPYVSKILKELHWSLIDRVKVILENEGWITQKERERCITKSIVEFIQLVHRQPVTEKEIKKCIDISVLLLPQGEFEIAKIFFGHTQRKNFKPSVDSYDFSKLLNFLVNCKLSDGYLKDYPG